MDLITADSSCAHKDQHRSVRSDRLDHQRLSHTTHTMHLQEGGNVKAVGMLHREVLNRFIKGYGPRGDEQEASVYRDIMTRTHMHADLGTHTHARTHTQAHSAQTHRMLTCTKLYTLGKKVVGCSLSRHNHIK